MGWSVGYDSNWKRDIGYGVPSVCDHPGCKAKIDRGLSYVCGGEPYGGDRGCGLYFCEKHLHGHKTRDDDSQQYCERCASDAERPFDPKPDTRRWMRWKLKDASWGEWRAKNPKKVAEIAAALAGSAP